MDNQKTSNNDIGHVKLAEAEIEQKQTLVKKQNIEVQKYFLIPLLVKGEGEFHSVFF